MNVVEKCRDDEIHRRAAELIQEVETVLDIGCGVRPQQFVNPSILICVEPFKDYREVLKGNLKDCNAIIIPTDAYSALSAMPSRSIDSIFLLDVIEHMTQPAGLAVISECERVARKQIVFYTPLGFMPQELHASEKDAWKLDGGKFQEHLSGWMPDDFDGYHILCCDNLHKFDFRGHPVSPPFGGFYAIKTLSTTGGAREAVTSYEAIKRGIPYSLKSKVEELRSLNERRSDLEIGIKSCQFTTEMLVSSAGDRGLPGIEILAESWRSENGQLLRGIFDDYYRALFESFSDSTGRNQHSFLAGNAFDESVEHIEGVECRIEGATRRIEFTRREQRIQEKEALLLSHEANLNSWKNDIIRRETWISDKEVSLAGHENNLASWEADVRRREAWIEEKQTLLAGHENNLNAWEADIRRRETNLSALREGPDGRSDEQ